MLEAQSEYAGNKNVRKWEKMLYETMRIIEEESLVNKLIKTFNENKSERRQSQS
jgi:hypothetical protein